MREIAIITITEASNNERSVLRAKRTMGRKGEILEKYVMKKQKKKEARSRKRIFKTTLFHERHGDIANRTIKPMS